MRNSSPPALSLDLAYQPEHKPLVKQHWNVTFAKQTKMSVCAKRIMARVLDQIRDDDFELRDFYQLAMSDVAEDAGISRETAYREVENALRELSQVAWEFKNVDSEQWQIRNLLDTTKEQSVGYQGGTITVLLNPQLAPYFIQIAHYTTYRLDSYLKLRSWYSMRLYELLAAFRDTGFWEVSVSDYRQLMDCWYLRDKRGRILKRNGEPRMKYPNSNDLIKYTTAEPQEELKDTDLAFDLVVRYEAGRVGRGRRKIVGLRFELKKVPSTTIPATWWEDSSTTATIKKLQSWKVSDRNIAQYAPILRREGIGKLIREWELKENSSKRIDNREKYCNAAFVRAAKAISEQQKAEALQVRGELQLDFFKGTKELFVEE